MAQAAPKTAAGDVVRLSQPQPLRRGEFEVDREAGLLRNVSIISEGEALGHNFVVDPTMLDQVASRLRAHAGGVKCHLTHGRGGLFSSSSGPAVVAEGTVEADKISYRSPRTHYLSLPGEAFQPGSDVPYYNSYGTGGAYIVSGSGALVAPVYLPEGATITELKAWFADASAADMSVKLHRFVLGGGSYTPMAEVSSSGSGGSMNASTTEIAYPVVSNATRAYLIYAYSTDWSSGLKLKNVRITYTVSEAE